MEEGVAFLSVSAKELRDRSPHEDYIFWFIRRVSLLSLRASNKHCVWLSRHVKYRWKGLLKARSPYAMIEKWGGEAFGVHWEGNKIALLCRSNGCFVSASSDGQLFADCSTSTPGPFELFTVEIHNDLLAFKSAHGKFIGLGKRGHLICSSGSVSMSEMFMLQIQVNILADNGLYVSADKHNVLSASKEKPTKSETFMLEVLSASISFRTSSERYWVAESNGMMSASTPATSNKKSARECFLFQPQSRNIGVDGSFVCSFTTFYGGVVTVDFKDNNNVLHAVAAINAVVPSIVSPRRRMSTAEDGSGAKAAPINSSPSRLTMSDRRNSNSSECERAKLSGSTGNLYQLMTNEGRRGEEIYEKRSQGKEKDTKEQDDKPEAASASLFDRSYDFLNFERQRFDGNFPHLFYIVPVVSYDQALSTSRTELKNSTEDLTSYAYMGEAEDSGDEAVNSSEGEKEGEEQLFNGKERQEKKQKKKAKKKKKQKKKRETHDEAVRYTSFPQSAPNEPESSQPSSLKQKTRGARTSPIPKAETEDDIMSSSNSLVLETSEHLNAHLNMRQSYLSEEWTIPAKDIILTEHKLGRGYFGEVVKGKWNGTTVAIKIIYRECFKDRDDLELFYKEAQILQKLRHPNIIQFLGVTYNNEKDSPAIVTEFMNGGSLHNFLQHHWESIRNDNSLRLSIAKDVAKGMCYLHSFQPPILHRDLSSKNILLDRHRKAKIADFGLSRIKAEQASMTTGCGALLFMSPEVYKGEKYSELADVYSYGMVLWELFTASYPHQSSGMDQIRFAAEVALHGFRPKIPDVCPKLWSDLIESCWAGESSQRPSFVQVLAQLKLIKKAKNPQQTLPSSTSDKEKGVGYEEECFVDSNDYLSDEGNTDSASD